MRKLSAIIPLSGILVGLMVLPAAPVLAHGDVGAAAVATPAPLTEADADTLQPGRYIWRPDLATDGAVNIVVRLDRQIAFVYRGDVLIGISTVSSGRDGYETPVGAFTVLEKAVEHRSNRYNDAPMPYMQRLTWDGVALHAGGVPGYRESHGCVHLPAAFAKALYGITGLGATVELTNDDAPEIATAATPPMAETATAEPGKASDPGKTAEDSLPATVTGATAP